MNDPIFENLYHACLLLAFPALLLMVTILWLAGDREYSWRGIFLSYWEVQ